MPMRDFLNGTPGAAEMGIEMWAVSWGFVGVFLVGGFRFGCFLFGFLGVAWGQFLKETWKNDKDSAKKEQTYYILSTFHLSFGTNWSSVGCQVHNWIWFSESLCWGSRNSHPCPWVLAALFAWWGFRDPPREDPNVSHQFLYHLRHNIAGNFQEYSWSHLMIEMLPNF